MFSKVNFEIFLGTLFRKFSFHEKICFRNFLILNFFFSNEIIFQILIFFEKNVEKFLRFRRKRSEKQTHIDNFLYFLYIFLYLKKKNSVNFRKKNQKKFWK